MMILHYYVLNTSNLFLSGFDLMERFSLLFPTGGSENQTSPGSPSYRMGRKLLVKPTQDVFPKGLPEEYSFVVTFRVKRNTRKERWYLWQVTDQFGIPQMSVILDGNRKEVEYRARTRSGHTLHLTFRNRQLHSLFDRRWHKLGVSVRPESVALHKGCKMVQRKLSQERGSMDTGGNITIGTRVQDGKPVDFELQRLTVYCEA
uniref:Thrombospondin-like N-terminal domain-containing protein n=1 Tax=Callorhinchus milii TaxID=7868 RepID=A0A4W3IJ11_CALMI